MRRLTNLIDWQDDQSSDAGVHDLSKSYEEEESTICGQKTHVVKGILRKMLDHQSEAIQKRKAFPRKESIVSKNEIKWSDQEMTALTEIFKDIVLGGEQQQLPSHKYSSMITNQPRVKLHPSQWSCDLSARN